MTNRSFYPLLLLLILFDCNSSSPTVYDLVIRNGQIIDGSGKPAYRADIGIQGDTIAVLQTNDQPIKGIKEIDASGYTVSPGFIDPHTHAMGDLGDTVRNANLNYLHQGVTTVFTGSDGRSVIQVGDRLRKWEEQGIGTNAIMYIGHGTVRQRVMGMRDAAPTEEELDNMKQLVAKGMKEGAYGLSSGLFYAPASYSTTEEVIELAKVAAQYGGNYDVHQRDESSYTIGLLAAVEETIRIAEEANIPAHIAHIKCLGVDVWGKSTEVIRMVEAARDRGLKVTADQYPYRASGSSITGALVPRWVQTDDPSPKEKLADPKLRPKIIAEMKENMRRRGGPESLLLTFPNKKDKDLVGLNLAQVSERWQVAPIEAAIRIYLNGGSSLGSFNMRQDDIANFMKQPWVMTGSDGSGGHPRKYGSYPKKIRQYVREEKVLPLNEMIQKSTHLPATTFGIPKRGLLKAGYYADIIIFKPEEVIDKATFEDPTALAEGMEHVLVNGQLAITDKAYTGALAGRALRRQSSQQQE